MKTIRGLLCSTKKVKPVYIEFWSTWGQENKLKTQHEMISFMVKV